MGKRKIPIRICEAIENGKRTVWVDIVKYICIILVMLSHLEARTEIRCVFFTPFFSVK